MRLLASGVAQISGREGPGGQGRVETTLGEDYRLINNRQGGRRRGRGGGGRPPSSSPGPGNRQDNRQRGNAAQLLEKYKGMARDAQMQGDRVLTENYLQFADHYFRVLNESRARFDEQRGPRRDEQDEDEDQDEQGARDGSDRDYGDQDGNRDRGSRDRDEEPERDQRPMRAERHEQGGGNGEMRPRRPRSRRPDSDGDGEPDGERIAADSLPPAISAVPDDDGEPRAPRARRPRRPRDQDEDIAPAA